MHFLQQRFIVSDKIILINSFISVVRSSTVDEDDSEVNSKVKKMKPHVPGIVTFADHNRPLPWTVTYHSVVMFADISGNNALIIHNLKEKTTYEGRLIYVRRVVDLMKTAKVNAYIMYIFGKIELLHIRAT